MRNGEKETRKKMELIIFLKQILTSYRTTFWQFIENSYTLSDN